MQEEVGVLEYKNGKLVTKVKEKAVAAAEIAKPKSVSFTKGILKKREEDAESHYDGMLVLPVGMV